MTKPIDILRKGVHQWNAWRDENLQIQPDLSGINLSGTNLSGANLTAVNLSASDLTGVDLRGADLTSSNLDGADFTLANLDGVDLTAANLGAANLTRANLTGANLTLAILSYTKLEHTNFYESQLSGTVFAFVNLNSSKNLETVLVRRPCSIDFDSLSTSPDIPKEFLLRVGFTDSQIDYLPDFVGEEGVQFYPVFLSHASVNKDFCTPLYEGLRKKGVKIWYDEKKIKPGDFIREEIHKGVSLYDKMLLVCSKESLNSWWVEQEIDRYEEKERDYWKQHGEKISLIIPIAIDDEVYVSKNAVAPNLRKRNIADFRKSQDQTEYEKAFEQLITALNVDRGGIEPKSFLKI